MTENQKDCIIELQEVLLSINEIVKKHGVENEFLAVLAVGFLDMSSSYIDEEGDERANMSLLSSFAVTDEEELDDMLSYCVEAYRMEQNTNTEGDSSKIDYWINLSRGDGSIN